MPLRTLPVPLPPIAPRRRLSILRGTGLAHYSLCAVCISCLLLSTSTTRLSVRPLVAIPPRAFGEQEPMPRKPAGGDASVAVSMEDCPGQDDPDPTTSTSPRLLARQTASAAAAAGVNNGKSSGMGDVEGGPTPKVVVAAAQAAGLLLLVFTVVWLVKYRGGISLSTDEPDALFNLHPLLMTVGLVVLFGQGILAYRILPLAKPARKLVHLVLMGMALAISLVALWAVLQFHAAKGIPDFYSLHSWFGVATLMLFTAQWLVGLYTFFYPGAPQPTRALVLPWHSFIGLFVFVLALATASQGVLEKMTFLFLSADVEKYGSEATLANVLGLSIFVFGALILLTATKLDRGKLNESHRSLL